MATQSSSTDNRNEDVTDTRPMVMARTIALVTIAISVVIFVIYKIVVCGCHG